LAIGDVAALLSWSSSAPIPLVEDAVHTDLLEDTGRALRIRHDLLRQAVHEARQPQLGTPCIARPPTSSLLGKADRATLTPSRLPSGSPTIPRGLHRLIRRHGRRRRELRSTTGS
jgi:hypothetical protein